VRALPREGDRDRPADAGIGAGDQRRLAFELAAAAIGLLAVIGLRIERFRPAGRLLLLRGLRRFWSGFSRVVVAHGGMVPWLRCLSSQQAAAVARSRAINLDNFAIITSNDGSDTRAGVSRKRRA